MGVPTLLLTLNILVKSIEFLLQCSLCCLSAYNLSIRIFHLSQAIVTRTIQAVTVNFQLQFHYVQLCPKKVQVTENLSMPPSFANSLRRFQIVLRYMAIDLTTFAEITAHIYHVIFQILNNVCQSAAVNLCVKITWSLM